MKLETLQPTPFWFLRHGETDWNIDSRAQGDIDIPLNATGLAQARAVAPRLRNRDTAQIVADELGLPVEFDEGLREVKFGVREGEPMAEWFATWVDGEYTPEGAESFVALRARAVAALNRALARPAPVLVVGHGALFRATRAEMGLEPNVRTPNATPYFCEPGTPWTLLAA
jgi:probable phosphoglycerate mutase